MMVERRQSSPGKAWLRELAKGQRHGIPLTFSEIVSGVKPLTYLCIGLIKRPFGSILQPARAKIEYRPETFYSIKGISDENKLMLMQ